MALVLLGILAMFTACTKLSLRKVFEKDAAPTCLVANILYFWIRRSMVWILTRRCEINDLIMNPAFLMSIVSYRIMSRSTEACPRRALERELTLSQHDGLCIASGQHVGVTIETGLLNWELETQTQTQVMNSQVCILMPNF